MAKQFLLLFGGSFDPIHHGHLIAAVSIAERIRADRVVLLPCGQPPHKPNRRLAPAAARLEMCRRAVAGDARFAVSDWELQQTGPNYTLLTVKHFRETDPNADLYWLIGMDGLRDLPTWHRIGELASLCTLVTAARPGFDPPDWSLLRGPLSDEQIAHLAAHVIETPGIKIEATTIRQRVAAGLSVRYLVPDAVAEYISEQRLYSNFSSRDKTDH